MPSCNRDDLFKFLEKTKTYDSIFYKSLSRNDHQWAENPNAHQSGVLIPRELSGFFGFEKIPETNSSLNLEIFWFLNSKSFSRVDYNKAYGKKNATIRYYCEGNRSSRPEVHLTNLYNPYFEGLTDGALLVIGRYFTQGEKFFDAIIIDSTEDDMIEMLIETIEIPDPPSWGVFKKEDVFSDFLYYDLLEQIAKKIYCGKMPKSTVTSNSIWELIKEEKIKLQGEIECPGISQSKAPFITATKRAPGNLVRWALQKAEFRLIKILEKEHYPNIILESLKKNEVDLVPSGWTDFKKALCSSLDEIVEIVKSLTQSRRSRVGQSFEHYIEFLLKEFGVIYERQSGSTRIDFLLEHKGESIILSAKTSARERWKQLEENSFFITLDRQITEEKIGKIKNKKTKIVVPEKDKKEISHYLRDDDILSFKDFFWSITSR